jgi:hypothetical protein
LGGDLGVLWGSGPRVCGAGPDTEGGDARRPCHGHAVGIGRLQHGLGLGSAAAEARGKRGARGRAVAPVVVERSGARAGG